MTYGRTDRQTHQKYSSELHKILVLVNLKIFFNFKIDTKIYTQKLKKIF